MQTVTILPVSPEERFRTIVTYFTGVERRKKKMGVIRQVALEELPRHG